MAILNAYSEILYAKSSFLKFRGEIEMYLFIFLKHLHQYTLSILHIVYVFIFHSSGKLSSLTGPIGGFIVSLAWALSVSSFIFSCFSFKIRVSSSSFMALCSSANIRAWCFALFGSGCTCVPQTFCSL